MNVEHSTNDDKLRNMARFIGEAPAGIVIEVGVWKGGSLRFMAERHKERQFYGFDTFQGLPEECEIDNFHRKGDFADTSLEEALHNLRGLPNVLLTRGLFPASDITGDLPIAMVHCDVDLYESTLNTFRHLWPRIAPGGRLYCDDAFQHTCEGATLALCHFATEIGRVPQFDHGMHAVFCK
jgi:hypothetical protein